ncbi:hypothetical protein [Micromonospora sp. NPDC092111]|uniref:hypothetical protein n=1 Tax=Micromonospora sp. NPDC092111 TaxID=3364289 RepID=UPI0038067AAD
MTESTGTKRRSSAWVVGLLVGVVIGWLMFEDAIGIAFGIAIGTAFAIAFGAFDRKKDGDRKKDVGSRRDDDPS